MVSGVGFMSDAYDLFVINLVKNVLFDVYPLAASKADNKAQQTALAAAVTTAALVGAIFGQLVFGFFADRLGRRTIFIATISLVIVGALGSATCSAPSVAPGADPYAANASVFWQLVFWRSVLGFGVGGEYPLSATVTSESHARAARGRSIALVFSMQGVGNLLASLVMLACLRSGLALDVVWRVALALGALPGILSVYWRWRMEESTHFVRVAAGAGGLKQLELGGGALGDRAGLLAGAADAEAGGADALKRGADEAGPSAGAPSAAKTLSTIWEFRWALLGTAGSWFIFDVVFYGNGLFSSTVLSAINYGSGSLTDLASGNALIALIGLPGYYVSLLTIDAIGRRNIQLAGFAAVGVVFAVMGGFLDVLEHKISPLFVFLYGLTFFFANFGERDNRGGEAPLAGPRKADPRTHARTRARLSAPQALTCRPS